MKRKITILNAEVTENELILEADSDIDLSGLNDAGQMLVDSDNLSFVYLAEEEEEYIYISVPEAVWPDIQKARQLKLQAIAVNNKGKLMLTRFMEELEYLIENIKGNSNYGEEMVAKVEGVF
ncbi:hypothetical protein [Mesobacillus harenae]|uniref:UPF0738 family protein n=1 Tax=Mesobacillus harenae TaxID=2213203 RepID=UPI00158050CD|nr:hypothetical protein [Mesobacillus harenae]